MFVKLRCKYQCRRPDQVFSRSGLFVIPSASRCVNPQTPNPLYPCRSGNVEVLQRGGEASGMAGQGAPEQVRSQSGGGKDGTAIDARGGAVVHGPIPPILFPALPQASVRSPWQGWVIIYDFHDRRKGCPPPSTKPGDTRTGSPHYSPGCVDGARNGSIVPSSPHAAGARCAWEGGSGRRFAPLHFG